MGLTDMSGFKNLRTALFFVRDYKRHVFGILALSALYAVFEGLNIAVLFPIISSVVSPDAPAAGAEIGIVRFLNRLIGVIPVKDVFIAACIFVIVVVLLKNVFRYLYNVTSVYASYKIWSDVQQKLFVKYIKADYRLFLDRKHGEIVYRLYNAPAHAGGILKLVPQLLVEILKVIAIGAMLFSMSFQVTCGIMLIAGLFYFFTRGISKKISYSLGKGRMEADQEENILVSEMINGIKQIKVFSAEKRWVSSFFRAMGKYFRLAKKDTLWINMPMSILEIFAMVSLSVFLIYMRGVSPSGIASSLPIIGVFAYAFQRIMPSLSLVTTYRMQIMGSLPVLEVLKAALDEEVSRMKDGPLILGSFNEKIEFRGIGFSYPGREEVIKDMNMVFDKNKCTALVGPSGSGKTTIVNLLIRLFDPVKGGIFIDGVDLRDYQKASWLRRIGFVSQDTFIFHASVSDNISFGLDGVSAEEIISAAKTANAHDFISRLPNGYDTIVGEKGMKLSGGEQQRLAIARAILRKPEILIFDEATSALDNMSQSLIQNSINKIAENHTVILIAHRLSTIVNADKIVVLDKGVIKETGSHAGLIAGKGYYWRLYNNEKDYVQKAG
ncbi:MAG: ABC transporter ATP-binding protein [Candidatus Omnitrophota bacterium]